MTKAQIRQLVISVGTLLIIILSIITLSNVSKINKLNKQIDTLKDVNEKLDNDIYENYVILTYIDKTKDDDYVKSYLINKNLDLSIYDFLLTTKDFTSDDFSSFDQKNYYFKDSMTDVLELKDNDTYYLENEYGNTLVKGLQSVKLNKNYTVVKSKYEG